MLARSCFLITLIKCLKGRKSLGSLCNVKSKSTLSQLVTRSPIELFWTAKNHPEEAAILSLSAQNAARLNCSLPLPFPQCFLSKEIKTFRRENNFHSGEEVISIWISSIFFADFHLIFSPISITVQSALVQPITASEWIFTS